MWLDNVLTSSLLQHLKKEREDTYTYTCKTLNCGTNSTRLATPQQPSHSPTCAPDINIATSVNARDLKAYDYNYDYDSDKKNTS